MTIARLVVLLAAAATGLAGLSSAVPVAAQGAPAVTGVAVTSEAGADATYARGETVRVTVAFSEAVAVTGTPTLAIDMDPAHWGTKRAAYESGGGTAALVFAHRVVEPNLSTQGIAVLADTLALNGGTIRSVSSQADAALAHEGLAHDASHKVDWRLADTVPPRLVRGEVDGGTMRLFFSEALDPNATGGRFFVDLARNPVTAGFSPAGPVSVTATPDADMAPGATFQANASAAVPLPAAYSAHFATPAPRSSFSRGVPVTATASLKVTAARRVSPCAYVPSGPASETSATPVTAGPVRLASLIFTNRHSSAPRHAAPSAYGSTCGACTGLPARSRSAPPPPSARRA